MVQGQPFDPCFYGVQGMNIGQRLQFLSCHGGFCNFPRENEPCQGNCLQTAGDPRSTQCLTFVDGTQRCQPSCGSDADCTQTLTFDQSFNPPALSTYCINYGGSQSACGPQLCYADGMAGLDDAGVLYHPCQNRPDTLCLPHYTSSLSTVLGFCQQVAPATAPTVGQACDPTAGSQATVGLCGSDAICLGGVCQQICDAIQRGSKGTPSCGPTETCVSAEGLNLVASRQVGGCGVPCDPFADEVNSGCANFCGGPPAKCNWIIGDRKANTVAGYCGAAPEAPAAVGQACGNSSISVCGAGEYCLKTSSGDACFKLCDTAAAAGSPDSCPSGKACTAFSGFTRAGYCP